MARTVPVMLTVDLDPSPPAVAGEELTALRAVWHAIRPLTAAHRHFPGDPAAVARWAAVTAALSRCRYLATHGASRATVARAHDRLEGALARAPRLRAAGGVDPTEHLWDALAVARAQLATVQNGGPATA